MMMATTVQRRLAVWLFGFFALTQQIRASEAEVKLSLDQFQELFSSATLKDAERLVLDKTKMQKMEYEKKLAELKDTAESYHANKIHHVQKLFPTNFQVLQHTASGLFNSSSVDAGVEGDVATFDLALTLRIMESSANWTVVPLVNTTMTVASNWQVFHQKQQESVSADGKDFQQLDPVMDPSVLLVQRDEQQVLMTNHSGLFKVTFRAFTRVGKTRNLNTVGLSSLLYPLSDLSLRIAKKPTTTTRDFSVQPPSSVLYVLQPSENFTDIQATLPLTADSFQIRWVDVQEQPQHEQQNESTKPKDHKRDGTPARPSMKPSESSAPQVTVAHEVMHTIGEGVIRSIHTLTFSTTNEQSPLNSVQFLVRGKRVRITSVAGHALQGWSSSEEQQEQKEANATTTFIDQGPASLVKATFKTSQLGSGVALKVHTETEQGDSSQTQVELPRIECKNVLRQTGQVAVVKDANVEVHESKTVGLSRVEPSDLSSKLRLNVDRPIVLSYKYLNPRHRAVLSVKEHVAMETLEATIDRVHYKVVMTEIHAVHSLILILQSTKLQYLELFNLPKSASKFTVLVNSVAAKPVKGDGAEQQDSILVPLLIGLDPETANQGTSLQTSVEVMYFSAHDGFGTNGTMALNLPQFGDLPVSVFSAHLSLPEAYKYNFTGDFGTKPFEKSRLYEIPEAFQYAKGKRVVKDDHEFSIVDDMFPEDRANEGSVRIVTPSGGRNYYFQKLLVLDGGLKLNVTYEKPIDAKKKEKKGFFSALF